MKDVPAVPAEVPYASMAVAFARLAAVRTGVFASLSLHNLRMEKQHEHFAGLAFSRVRPTCRCSRP